MESLFSNEDMLNEFCRVSDREFGCKDAFGCLRDESVCPLKLSMQVDSKGPKSASDVASKTEVILRSHLETHSRDRILAEYYKNPHRVYPRARILCELEVYLLKHIVPDSAIIYWKDGEIKRIDQWK